MADLAIITGLMLGLLGLGFGYWKGWQHALNERHRASVVGRMMEAGTKPKPGAKQ